MENSLSDKSYDRQALLEYLAEAGIAYQMFEHPPVYTCEEASLHLHGKPGKGTKNLFLRDKKGAVHVLVILGEEKIVDLQHLSQALQLQKLGFASPERLQRYLGVEPGSVTLLGLVNDRDHAVRVVIDSELWNFPEIQCHPLDNRATLVIGRHELENFLTRTGHSYELVEIQHA